MLLGRGGGYCSLPKEVGHLDGQDLVLLAMYRAHCACSRAVRPCELAYCGQARVQRQRGLVLSAARHAHARQHVQRPLRHAALLRQVHLCNADTVSDRTKAARLCQIMLQGHL